MRKGTKGVGKGGRGHRRMGQEGMGGKDRVHLAGQKTLRVAIDVHFACT